MSEPRSRRGWQRNFWGLLVVAVLFSVLTGCGGSKTTMVAPTHTIAFSSARALDGSDGVGTQNIWLIKSDGSGASPLTKNVNVSLFNAFPAWSPDGGKLAFESIRALDGSDAANTNNTVNIWAMNSDGTSAIPLTKITAAGVVTNGPIWSPDSSKVFFSSGRALDASDAANANNTENVWVVSANGSGATPLTKLTAAGTLTFVAARSPDGSKLLLSSSRALDGSDAANANSTFNVWVMNSDGSGATPLTKHTANGASSFAGPWSPDGKKLAFASTGALDGSDAADSNAVVNLWVMNADGSSATPLTKLTSVNSSIRFVAWSPDGSKIAFTSSRSLDGLDSTNANMTPNIWVVNPDGSGTTVLSRLTTAGTGLSEIEWSPDSTQLLFVSARALDGSDAVNANNSENIWVMNADGSGAAPLTKLTAPPVSNGPAWKP